MTIETFGPLPGVGAAVNGEKLAIVVESRRHPDVFCVASGAIGREHQCLVVGVGSGSVVGLVAAVAGIGGVVVVAVVAGGTLVGDGGVGAVEGIEVVVDVKGGGLPARFGGVAGGTIFRQAQIDVAGVVGLVEIFGVTCLTSRWCTRITRGVALGASSSQVGTRQGKSRQGVVEDVLHVPCGVAGQAGRIFIDIPVYGLVGIAGGGIGVANGTAEHAEVAAIGMTGCAGIPRAGMGSRVNGEETIVGGVLRR